MPNSVLLVIDEDTKNVTLFHNEEHDAMQSFNKGSDRIIQSPFRHGEIHFTNINDDKNKFILIDIFHSR